MLSPTGAVLLRARGPAPREQARGWTCSVEKKENGLKRQRKSKTKIESKEIEIESENEIQGKDS